MYLLALELFCLLLVPLCMPLSAQDTSSPEKLNIVLLEGEGAINNIRQHVVKTPIVRVEREDKQPVSGAVVVFTLPSQGPGGNFPNGLTLTTITDEEGRAAAPGLRLNTVAGKMEIRVNVSFRGEMARAKITQFNMAVPETGKTGSSGKKKIIIVAVAGAAIAGGVLAGTHIGAGGGQPAAAAPVSVPIGITPGAGAAGPPR